MTVNTTEILYRKLRVDNGFTISYKSKYEKRKREGKEMKNLT